MFTLNEGQAEMVARSRGVPSGGRVWDPQAFRILIGTLREIAKNPDKSDSEYCLEMRAAVNRFLSAKVPRMAVELDAPLAYLEERNRPVGHLGLNQRELNLLEDSGFATVRAFLAAERRDFQAAVHKQLGEVGLARFAAIQAEVRIELGLDEEKPRRNAVERALAMTLED